MPGIANYFNKIYINHIGWRKRKWIFKKYLNNGQECFESRQLEYNFKKGHKFLFEELSSAEHIFSEIFIGECYKIEENDKKLTIIDVGSNIGFFSYYALLKCPNSFIYSIEASPGNFKILQTNIIENGLESNILPLNKIVSSESNKKVFYSSENPGWSSLFNERGAAGGKEIELDSIKLSSLFLSQKLNIIDILKIDVEGAEYDIILNDNFLDRYKVKQIYIEADKNPRDVRFSFEELIIKLEHYYKVVNINYIDPEYPLIHCIGYKI